MRRTRNPYTEEFRNHLIDLAPAGRSIVSLTREFEPCAATIHGWVKQAGIDKDELSDGLTGAEYDEFR